MTGIRQQMAAVVAEAAPYWAGEAEVVETYFQQPRTLAEHLFWLRAQTYKESVAFRDLPQHLQDELFSTGRLSDHPGGAKAARRMGEELKHFTLLAELIADLSGTVVCPADLSPLPEDCRLQELRALHRQENGALEDAVVAFSEGGGGAMYWVMRRLDGGAFERRVGAIFEVIYADEIAHGPMEIYRIAHHARSAADWEQARAITRNLSRQRVLMRNEMFGFPLGPARIREIGAGRITPWKLPVPI
jgi:hypothetical protein